MKTDFLHYLCHVKRKIIVDMKTTNKTNLIKLALVSYAILVVLVAIVSSNTLVNFVAIVGGLLAMLVYIGKVMESTNKAKRNYLNGLNKLFND